MIERLGRLLGDPELEWLLARVRRRLELGQPLEGVVTLADASAAQRRAAQRLLGRPPRAGRALSVSLHAVDEVAAPLGCQSGWPGGGGRRAHGARGRACGGARG